MLIGASWVPRSSFLLGRLSNLGAKPSFASVASPARLARPKMASKKGGEEDEVMSCLRKLLRAIDAGDYATYRELNDAALTAFEPEAHGALVEGLDFHKFYFDNCPAAAAGTVQSSIASPKIQLLGKKHALVTYTRVVQRMGADGVPRENATNESRVFGCDGEDGAWKCLHFHRSAV